MASARIQYPALFSPANNLFTEAHRRNFGAYNAFVYRDWRHPKFRSQCLQAWGLKHLDRRGCGSNHSRKLSKSERRKHQMLVQTAAVKDVDCRVHSWQKRAYDTMCQVIHRFTLPSSETARRSSSKIRGCCVSSACSNIPRRQNGRSGHSHGSGRAASVRRHLIFSSVASFCDFDCIPSVQHMSRSRQ